MSKFIIIFGLIKTTFIIFEDHELMEKIEENEGKKYSMIDDHILDKLLDKTETIIDIEKIYDTKIFIDTVINWLMKLQLILISSVIKDDNKVYPQLFLEEALVA